ncbi:DWNN-domain-containing protein [Dacryopinax primogenitus]|uniref:DWNN-domain-containing protein n=1 Tax=Dacryopinax primogenitus (strain DJM 731) TaxID=1858805 RepID=M5G0M0_DACPD|nr:DWNN-domain-containing protein [Dacryopinax primogenitus]EJU03796.1 DWNN-domain-containing protein [Dacryopinax primogenitus]
MASSVYYKFKSQRDESRITFDGTGISVFDLKREIMVANKMGTGNDFDLGVYDPKSDKEYNDEDIVPRSSSVVVRRQPPSKSGRGKAQIYVANLQTATPTPDPRAEGARAPVKPLPSWKPGQGSISQRFDGKEPSKGGEKQEENAEDNLASTTLDDEEQAAIAAMFQATSEQWQQTQEKMAQATPIHNSRGRGGFKGGRPYQHHQAHEQPSRPPPLGYTCYRCGQKGHWIQECPTNGDQDFDNRPRIKRTTGIPRSFLKAVENPIATGNNMPGVMVTPDGGYVIAQADSATWEKQRAKAKAISENDIRERPVTDPTFACPVCSKLFREATRTPCCGATYCEECIQTHLLEHDFVCPSCSKRIGSLDRLEPDSEMRRKVKQYIYKAMEEAKEEDDESSKGPLGDLGKVPTPDESINKNAPRPDYSAQIATLQDSIKQMTALLSKPNMNMQDRQRLQIRLQQTNEQLAQIQMMTAMYEMSNAAGVEGMEMNGMNMGMNVGMNGFMGWQGNYGQEFGMFPNHDMGIQQGANFVQQQGQLRGQKRGRPQDFVQVDQRSEKMGRYY